VSLGGGAAFGFPGALARLKAGPWRALSAATFVARARYWLSRAPHPERLFAHFLLPCGVPIATGRPRVGTQVEVVVHGSDARLYAASPARARAWIVGELLRHRASLRFVSTELMEVVLSGAASLQREALRPRCRVEPCAIDVPRELSRARARALLGWSSEPLAVIVARLVRGKRVHVALEACRRVPRLRAVVVGDGPERRELERAYPEATFVGHVDRARALAWLAAADVLVSASRLEGAPTVVREARALGTAVVCLEAGDLRLWSESDPGIHVVAAP
jgi:glycosyltransferase involved in cell wall biosynthesis